jgi:hypothetical protein
LVSYQANVVNLDFIMRRRIFINSRTLSWYLFFNDAIININFLKFILTEALFSGLHTFYNIISFK